MRQQRNVLHTQQGRGDLRLFLVHIQPCACYLAARKRLRQRALIHHIPARDVDENACAKLGAAAGEAVEAFLYQKFVREYIRNASPYRGVLVYHGLGSGKTCSAIAAAEAAPENGPAELEDSPDTPDHAIGQRARRPIGAAFSAIKVR
jgi:hypothetical protein